MRTTERRDVGKGVTGQIPGQDGDGLCRFVHLALVVYLAPVFLVVIALGAVLVVVTGVIGFAAKLATATRSVFSARPATRTDSITRRLVKAPLVDRYERTPKVAPHGGAAWRDSEARN